MTSTIADLLTLPGIDVTPLPGPARPAHYLVVTRVPNDEDEDNPQADPGHSYPIEDSTDDLDVARVNAAHETEMTKCEAGIFDNWTGEWVCEPWWAAEVETTAEGSTRYDLRPE